MRGKIVKVSQFNEPVYIESPTKVLKQRKVRLCCVNEPPAPPNSSHSNIFAVPGSHARSNQVARFHRNNPQLRKPAAIRVVNMLS